MEKWNENKIKVYWFRMHRNDIRFCCRLYFVLPRSMLTATAFPVPQLSVFVSLVSKCDWARVVATEGSCSRLTKSEPLHCPCNASGSSAHTIEINKSNGRGTNMDFLSDIWDLGKTLR